MSQHDARPETLLPELASHPKVDLSHGETPLERLENLGPRLGIVLWAKRDDCNGLAMGGNKVRHLEYYLGRAAAEGADTVVITGALQSNFVRLAAAAARRLGWQAEVQLEDRVPNDDLFYRASGNYLLSQMLGAGIHHFSQGESEAAADRNLDEIAARLRRKGRRPFVIHLGIEHPPVGGLGYVEAACETRRQLQRMGREPSHVVIPSGSGLTHAGFLVGARALGWQVPVLGVCVRRDAVQQHQRVLRRARRRGLRQALFVGHAGEALRLQHMLTGQSAAPFELVGYITPEAGPELEAAPNLPCLGTLNHLRDLVRLRRLEDVIFAAANLSNQTIFTLMQRLHGLPAQTRILAEDREHVIGKASIDHLSTPSLIEAEEALGTPRSPTTRRVFEAVVSVLGMVGHPFISVMAWIKGEASFWHRLAQRTRRWPEVLRGRQALVGYRPDDPFHPPPEWKLQPGVFAVTDTLGRMLMTPEEADQAYWFYVRNQSAFLDWIIVMRAIRTLR